MDPVSQAVLGAAVAQVVVGDRLGRKVWWLGALGGMAPDLDVLIRSAGDPMLALEFHRHFTHSLAFIPIGGALVAAPFLIHARTQPTAHKRWILAATTLGWATHGLLDAFTSYGTMLWWPFARTRVALDWISVIDPIYTVILAVGVALAAKSINRRPAAIALACSTLYLGLCGFQHHRALVGQAKLAELRNHSIDHGRVQPLLLTNLLWRSIYADEGVIYVDAMAVRWSGSIGHYGGDDRAALEVPSAPESAAERDLATFAWFADGWVYAAPELDLEAGATTYCDARYSNDPSRFDGIFCVVLTEEGASAVLQRRPPDSSQALSEMLAMLSGAAPNEAL